jgi:hypothetical protein
MTVHADQLDTARGASTLSTTAAAFSVAAAITLVFNAVLTIVKDSSEPLNNFMAGVLGHHWITHGVLIIVVYLVLGWVLTKSEVVRGLSDSTLIGSVVIATLINGGVIALWFFLF